jgi:hypothetical protein
MQAVTFPSFRISGAGSRFRMDPTESDPWLKEKHSGKEDVLVTVLEVFSRTGMKEEPSAVKIFTSAEAGRFV